MGDSGMFGFHHHFNYKYFLNTNWGIFVEKFIPFFDFGINFATMNISEGCDGGIMGVSSVKRDFEHSSRLSREEIHRLQTEKLRALVKHSYDGCAAYRKLMDSAGVKPSDIRSVDDIQKLPIVEKKHILDNAPWGFVSKPKDKIARFIESSGSTGKPKFVAISKAEKQRLFELAARSFYLSGVRGDGIIFPMLPHGPWASAFFVQNGLELIGPTIPAEMSLPLDWHISRIQAYRPKYLITSPSFASKLYEEGQDRIDFPSLGLNRMVLGAEGIGKTQRKRFEELFGTTVLQGYGCTEIGVPAAECEEKSGLHWFADEYIIEAVDPETKEPVAPGEIGEMLITALFKDSMPMIRYAMRDLIYLKDEKCSCGCNMPLMSYILGRSDDMMTLGAANVYPHQIMDAVASVPQLTDKFQFIVGKRGLRDHARLKVELRRGEKDTGIAETILGTLKSQISELFFVTDKAGMIADPEIEVLPFGTFSKGSGFKFKRFINEREGSE